MISSQSPCGHAGRRYRSRRRLHPANPVKLKLLREAPIIVAGKRRQPAPPRRTMFHNKIFAVENAQKRAPRDFFRIPEK
jgi:hypothetical protein